MNIIVDIDNTLWHFAPVLYERMKKANPDFTPLTEWHKRDIWKVYGSPRIFYNVTKSINMDQEQFTPYPDAQVFLSSLKELDFHITIESHREKGTDRGVLLSRNDKSKGDISSLARNHFA
ncbi:MAG: hypothetical protein C0392_03750 [Syntrophus sp. (in: bacteria)]|nr:hypothetical protein [Syntrophus sp. (in: bacteria)]